MSVELFVLCGKGFIKEMVSHTANQNDHLFCICFFPINDLTGNHQGHQDAPKPLPFNAFASIGEP